MTFYVPHLDILKFSNKSFRGKPLEYFRVVGVNLGALSKDTGGGRVVKVKRRLPGCSILLMPGCRDQGGRKPGCPTSE